MPNTAIAASEQLIHVFKGQIGGIPANVCDARELHSYLKNGDKFAGWIKARIKKYVFEENKDFQSFSVKTEKPNGGRPSTEYHLSLDMAKELSMVENNEQGRKARRYFIDCERKVLESAGQLAPALHTETLTPSEQQTLSEIVHRKALPYAELQSKALAEIWSRLHHKFRIAKYSQLPRAQLTEAIVYLGQMQVRLPLPVQDESTPEQRTQMHRAIQDMTSNWLMNTDSCRSWIHNRLRTEFNVRRLEDIPARRVDEALALMADIKASSSKFLSLVCGMREAFCHEVIGAGHLWTPWITRQLGGAQALPPNPDWQALGKVLLLSKPSA